MSDNESHNVVEDVPKMRSVALQQRDTEPLLMRSAYPMSKSSPATLSSEVIKMPLSSSQWHVKNVQQLPVMYQLERTHINVEGVAAQTIADRVTAILQQESIASTVHERECMIDCETAEHVHFCVRLFRENEHVIVEVQRLAGCGFLFHQVAKCVLKGAKGAKLNLRRASRSFSIPKCVPKIDSGKKDVEEALETASCLMKQDRIDAHLMALETLAHLSQATSEQRGFTAHCILCGEFLETLVCLIESYRMPNDVQSVLSDIEKSHLAMMRRHALNILASCLLTLEQSGELAHLVEKQHELSSKGLLMALVDEVAGASTRPHDACSAVRCLQSLVKDSSARSILTEMGLLESITSANETGVCRHAALQA
jgi:hypothetical protein